MYIDTQKQEFKKYLSEDDFQKLRLWDSISEKNLLALLKVSEIKRVTVGYNNYGEFMFIHFIFAGEHYFAYGLGLHEYRGKVYRNTWKMMCDSDVYTNERISYNSTLQKIKERKQDIKHLKGFSTKETELFNLIADFSDDDSALSNIDLLLLYV